MNQNIDLNPASLASLDKSIARPGFDVLNLKPGIVHLGIGAFHRAHMAWYTQHALQEDPSNGDWGINGFSFRSASVRDALAPQEFLYSLIARENDSEEREIMGIIRGVDVVAENPLICPQRIAHPSTRIVSLTVSEKGYCHDPATGHLDENNTAIISDWKTPNRPRTAIGALSRGLRLRRDRNSGPVALMSCDNLPSNGAVLERIVRRFIEIGEPDLLDWIDENVCFPKCMVDRIVPALTEADRKYVETELGFRDKAPVIAEKFSQWVIEDRFPAGRPSWELAGVEMVSRVEDYETVKLRLLNGPHSASAYLGYLSGFEFVSDLMTHDIFPRFLHRMMAEEITPGLKIPDGVDIGTYQSSILDRFANRALSHSAHQIAMDGSQKLPQRILSSIRSALDKDLPIDCLCLSLAAWMRYVSGQDERGQRINVSDPLAPILARAARSARENASSSVQKFMELTEIFGEDLPKSERFTSTVSEALSRLYAIGALKCVADYALR